MARRSIFSIFKRGKSAQDSILMTDLVYPESSQREDTDDLSLINVNSYWEISPKITFDTEQTPQIPVIGIGGCGIRLAEAISRRFVSYEVNMSIMGIDTNKEELDAVELSHKYLIKGMPSGSGRQYRKGASLATKAKTKLMEAINSYLEEVEQDYKHEIVFILLGAGGTGVGAGIEIAKLLIKEGKRPVPFLVIPSREENTRIKFNCAVAFYYFNYAPSDKCLNLSTICIDNEYLLEKNSKNSYAVSLGILNERVGSTIADLIASTNLDSHGYSVDLNEFLEVFRQIKGVGCLNYMHSGDDYNKVSDFFESKYNNSNSMNVEILSSTRSYIYIESLDGLVSSSDYRSLIEKFRNSDIFPKFREEPEAVSNFEIRGIFTGIKIPEKIHVLMQMAEDARVEVLNSELEATTRGKHQPKIDRLQGDEEINVMTGEELAKERSEEFALRRRGEIE